jgi:hypothetical protein
VIAWDLTVVTDLRESLHERACSVTSQGLDPEEWSRFIPDLPYARSCAA